MRQIARPCQGRNRGRSLGGPSTGGNRAERTPDPAQQGADADVLDGTPAEGDGVDPAGRSTPGDAADGKSEEAATPHPARDESRHRRAHDHPGAALQEALEECLQAEVPPWDRPG